MARTAIASGPLFRPVDRHGRLGPGRLSGQAVAAVVKRSARAAGLDPAFFAGHSLRAGHVTQAKRNDATDLEVMSQTHHRSAESIAGYVREADLFRHTSARRLGL
jgi:integrase